MSFVATKLELLMFQIGVQLEVTYEYSQDNENRISTNRKLSSLQLTGMQ